MEVLLTERFLTIEVLSVNINLENQAVINLKNNNVALELEILELAVNFREDNAIKIVPEQVL